MAQTNVLVVEDESIVSKDIQHSLKKLGYNVVGAAATGEQAVKLALLDYLGDQKRLLMDAGDDASPTQVLGAASAKAE